MKRYIVIIFLLLSISVKANNNEVKEMSKSKVYFTKEITSENLIKLYEILDKKLEGKVAVKITSSEHDKKYNIQPYFMKPLIDKVNGTLVECNTAYSGRRNTTEKHWKLIKDHGFTEIAPFDLMDEDGEIELKVNNGKQIKINYVGKNLKKYDSILVLSHFKGHQMAGFGGALKNVAIGIASSHGKVNIHGAGDVSKIWTQEQDKFLEAMADAVKSVIDYKKGKMVYINVMKDMSIDCDCNSNPKKPEIKDIGILASTDPVALDQACVDLIYNSKDEGKKSLIKRMEDQHGIHILEASEEIGIGSRNYNLINMDK